METQLMAGAFLKYGNEALLIKRSLQKEFNPGKFAPIGANLKPEELNTPARACLREITEETGIEVCDIVNFELRLITVMISFLIMTSASLSNKQLRSCLKTRMSTLFYLEL